MNDKQEAFVQVKLLGLPSFDKWDNCDGYTDQCYWTRDETKKTKQLLDGCICAQCLAMDSYSIADVLYTSISMSYKDTIHSGKFDSSQVWTLMCSFVKKMLQENRYVRVVVRDGIHMDDHWGTASRSLFTALKAHTVYMILCTFQLKTIQVLVLK